MVSDDYDPFNIRSNILLQLLALIKSEFVCFEDKKSIISFITKNNWINALKNNSQILLSEFEKCLLFELKQIEIEFVDIYQEISEKKTMIESIFKINKGRLIMRQNDKQVLGKCPFIVEDIDKFSYNTYYQQCIKYEINPLSVNAIKSKKKLQIYMDFLWKIANKIKPFIHIFIESTLKPFYYKFESCSIKPYHIIMNSLNNDDYIGYKTLDIVRCCLIFKNITKMIKGFEKLKNNKSRGFKLCYVKINRITNNDNDDDIMFGNYRYISCYGISQHPDNQNVKLIVEIKFCLLSLWLKHKKYVDIIKTFETVLSSKLTKKCCYEVEKKLRNVNDELFESWWNDEILHRKYQTNNCKLI